VWRVRTKVTIKEPKKSNDTSPRGARKLGAMIWGTIDYSAWGSGRGTKCRGRGEVKGRKRDLGGTSERSSNAKWNKQIGGGPERSPPQKAVGR
jgi:hypothetical protein